MTVTFLDGGMGHLLKSQGCIDSLNLPYDQQFLSSCLANIHAPLAVTAAHQAYLNAGCDVITSNSFVATPHHVSKLGSDVDYLKLVAVRSLRISRSHPCSMWCPVLWLRPYQLECAGLDALRPRGDCMSYSQQVSPRKTACTCGLPATTAGEVRLRWINRFAKVHCVN
jgi:Homocysteine S-methyltransferase